MDWQINKMDWYTVAPHQMALQKVTHQTKTYIIKNNTIKN
jgi:hypothetical protein